VPSDSLPFVGGLETIPKAESLENEERLRTSFLDVAPVALVVCCLILVVVLWQTLEARESRHMQSVADSQADRAVDLVRKGVLDRVHSLHRMVDRWKSAKGTAEAIWRSDAQAYARDQPGCQAIAWADSRFDGLWVEPVEAKADLAAINSSLQQYQMVDWAKVEAGFVATLPIQFQGRRAFVVMLPIIMEERLDGFVLNVVDVEFLLDDTLSGISSDDHITLRIASEIVVAPEETSTQQPKSYSAIRDLEVGAVPWSLEVSMGPESVAATLSILPRVVLVGGLLFSLLAGVLLGLVRRTKREIEARAQAEAALSMLNDNLASLVEERTQELALVAKNLDERSTELEDFTYIACHDLRSPLQAIENLAIWLEEDEHNELSADSLHYLRLIRDRTKRMNGVMDGLLAYFRVSREREPDQVVNLRALVLGLVEQLDFPPAVEAIVSSSMPTFRGPKRAVEQLLYELLSNALVHRERMDGFVEISAHERDDAVEITVRDDGSGIEPRFQEKVFGIFQTLRARKEGDGAGVGLALVKKIADLYGCNIGIESEFGQGTLVRVKWPLSSD
jgi:signal transduction histidine kinase